MIYLLLVAWNVACIVSIFYGRWRIRETLELADRLQHVINEMHSNWSRDQDAWERRVREMRDRMAVIDYEHKVVYAGPEAVPNILAGRGSVHDMGDGWRVIRLASWEEMPL